MAYDENGKAFPFSVDQDRTIDRMTVETYCTGCPFKKVKSTRSQRGSGTSSRPVDFASVGGAPQNPMNLITYKCTSPNFDYKKTLMKASSTIGFGYCPFFLQRWALKDGEHDPDDPPMTE